MAEGEQAPVKCPKCGVGSEKFSSLSEEDSKKIYSADRTNDILAEVQVLAAKIAALCAEGLDINLDPGCVASFKASKDRAWEIKQLVKAETAIHVGKSKW